ncbi:hypothetical protein PUN4_550254 [Paraburkholderia unamae]|nr:hypothetical protein PUN4_550254 [Paraburkholderia unamae]
MCFRERIQIESMKEWGSLLFFIRRFVLWVC